MNLRMDYRGYPILKGKKTHKVSFIDEIKDVKIYDIICVDCYKPINFVPLPTTKNVTHDCYDSCCIIF